MAIPLPGMPGEAFLKGLGAGSNMFSNMMQPVIQREQLAQQWRKHLDDLELRKAAAGRVAAMAPLQQRLAQLNLQKLEREVNPAAQMEYIQSILEGVRGMRGRRQQSQQVQPMELYSGMGMPSVQEMENPTIAPPAPEVLQQGFEEMFTPEEQMALNMAGIKVPDNPVLKAKRELEKKRIEEEQALDIKERRNLEHEIPEAQKLLSDVRQAKIMASKHPEWFGAGVAGLDILGGPNQRKRSINDPDFGKLETIIGNLIAPTAQKFSTRGLKTALDLAVELKPGFGENLGIAMGKLEQIEKELGDAINREKTRLGKVGGNAQAYPETYGDNELVEVETPQGIQIMTYAQARQLGAQ